MDGSKVKHLDKKVKLTIDTKCPQKWAFVDMETGEIWVHKTRFFQKKNALWVDFYRADEKALLMVRNIAAGRVVEKMGYSANENNNSQL